MQLKDYIDIDKLARYVEEGIVSARKHPTVPLTIYCYSKRATFENIWDDITIKTRGLIVDDKGEIIARPFEKFFNLDTVDKPETHYRSLPTTAPEAYEKLDGSLGIFWEYENFYGVASKGSFSSDHAAWATYWYSKTCKNHQWPAGYTPVFEMICQAVQTHVVFYEMPDQLILLALINKETGEEMPYNDLYHYAFLNGLQTVEIFNKSVATVLDEDRSNKEGYVLSWPRPGQTPLKVKVKHETFLKLQKIVHAATPKNILDALKANDYAAITLWKESTSPELSLFVQKWFGDFHKMFGDYMGAAERIVKSATTRFGTRKEQADFIRNDQNIKYAAVSFALLDRDEKGTDPAIAAWKLVENWFKEELDRPVMGDPDDDDLNGRLEEGAVCQEA